MLQARVLGGVLCVGCRDVYGMRLCEPSLVVPGRFTVEAVFEAVTVGRNIGQPSQNSVKH